MASNTESLVFDLLVRDSASAGLSNIGKAADGASRNTDALTKRLNDLSRKSVEARLRLAGDKEALASLDKMDARLISLDRRVASPNMKVEGAARAIAEISAVDLELDKLGGQGGTAEVTTGKLAGLQAGMAGLQTPMAGLVVAGVALSPVIATVGTGMAGLGVAAYATVAPILAAASATGGLKANLATLSPVQQQMARELLALEGTASGFAKSLQPEVVKLWGDGMTFAGTVLKDIQPVAAATGTALHGVLGAVNASFATGPWHDFFGFMAQQAGPDTQMLGKLLVDLLNDLPPLVQGFQPLASMLLIIVDDTLKAVGWLERMHVLMPLLGAAIGFVVAGPIGALAGGLAGVALEAAAAGGAIDKTRLSIDQLAQVKMPSSAAVAVDWAAVAANLKTTAVSATDVRNAMIDAHPAVGTIRGDMDLLGTSTTTATVALQAYSDLWNLFVGNAVSDQQAVLNVTLAFENFDKTVANSKKTSAQAQQAFLGIFTAIGTGLDTLHKNGASVSQLNSFYQTSIGRLNALHGLTPAQRADVQGLTKDYLAWANSVQGLSGNTVKAAGVIRTSWLATMSLTHQLVPVAKKDADAFADSVLKTGTSSRTTKHDRDVLIADLVHSGLSAAQAKADVIQFQGQIDKLKGKTVPIGATFSGTGHIKASQSMTGGQVQTVGNLLFVARGGRIPGYGGGDIRPAMLEPGETVFPKHLTPVVAPIARAYGLPGFAAGGLVGMEAGMAGIAPFGKMADAHFGAFAGQAFGKAAETAFAAAAAVITGANAGGRFIGVGSPAGSGPAAFAQVAARMGWGPAELAAWNYVEMREAGYSLTATNPSSGAYGMAQFINGAGEYAQWGGNSTTYIGQATAMANYIKSRYNDPIAAAAHEAAFNWYGTGLQDALFTKPTIIGVGDAPGGERVTVTPAGRASGGGGVTYNISVAVMPGGEAAAGRAIVDRIKAFERGSGKGWRS